MGIVCQKASPRVSFTVRLQVVATAKNKYFLTHLWRNTKGGIDSDKNIRGYNIFARSEKTPSNNFAQCYTLVVSDISYRNIHPSTLFFCFAGVLVERGSIEGI